MDDPSLNPDETNSDQTSNSDDTTNHDQAMEAERDSEAETHPGDEVAFVIAGRACVLLPETRQVFDLQPRDAMFVPQGIPHLYFNEGDEPARVVFATAPRYR